MDSHSITLIIILGILVCLSAFFSAAETAFTSYSRVRMKNLAQGGSERAELVLKLSENYNKLISTVLIGNNIVNITSASLGTVLFVKYFANHGVTVSTVVMTVVVLMFGETAPKSVAKKTPEKYAMVMARGLQFALIVLSPVSYLFGLWQKLINLLFKTGEEGNFTEEELLIIVDEVEQEGNIDEHEGNLIRSAIEFNDLDAVDIYTPRVDVCAVSDRESKESIARMFIETGYSRLPVFNRTIDNIIGVITEKDFNHFVYHTDKGIDSILKSTLYVPPNMKISKLLRLLQQSKSHIAIVTDEYGGTLGIVTMEDILEELVGEIWDEHDEIIEEFYPIRENEYRVVCAANLEKMFDFFALTSETDSDYNTVSGWVIEQLDKIPEEGDVFTYENLEIQVEKVEARRVLTILVKVHSPEVTGK